MEIWKAWLARAYIIFRPPFDAAFEIVKWLWLRLVWIQQSLFCSSELICVVIVVSCARRPETRTPVAVDCLTPPKHPLPSTLHHLLPSKVVVHSSLTTGPQPTVVQERRYSLYLLKGSKSRRIHLVVSGLLMSTVCTGPTSSVSLTIEWKNMEKQVQTQAQALTKSFYIERKEWFL